MIRAWTVILAASCLGAAAAQTVPAARAAHADHRSEHQTEHQTAEQSARAFRSLRLPGSRVRRAVAKLARRLEWHRSLDRAIAAADRSGKPVVWIQALGSLRGFT